MSASAAKAAAASTTPTTTTSTGTPTFPIPISSYGRTLAQVDSTIMLRLSDAPVLPFQFGRFAATVGRYLDQIEKLPNQKRRPDLSKVRAEVAQLTKTSAAFDNAYESTPKLASATPAKLAPLNRILFHTERDLTLDPGLPGRPGSAIGSMRLACTQAMRSRPCPVFGKPWKRESPTKRSSRPAGGTGFARAERPG